MAEREQNEPTPAALRACLVGHALEHDEEEIRFWRQASEEERGQTLYQLLRFAQNVIDSAPERPAEPLRFPGFGRQRTEPPAPEL